MSGRISHAEPAEAMFAACTIHPIASVSLLDESLASWAFLGVSGEPLCIHLCFDVSFTVLHSFLPLLKKIALNGWVWRFQAAETELHPAETFDIHITVSFIGHNVLTASSWAELGIEAQVDE